VAKLGDKCAGCGEEWLQELMTGSIIIFHRNGCPEANAKSAQAVQG
jgi:hypothetical protein